MQSTYSEYEIGRLLGQLKSNATYGSIKVLDLNKGFSGIEITSGQAQIATLERMYHLKPI